MAKIYDELKEVTIRRLEGELAETRKENVNLQKKRWKEYERHLMLRELMEKILC